MKSLTFTTAPDILIANFHDISKKKKKHAFGVNSELDDM